MGAVTPSEVDAFLARMQANPRRKGRRMDTDVAAGMAGALIGPPGIGIPFPTAPSETSVICWACDASAPRWPLPAGWYRIEQAGSTVVACCNAHASLYLAAQMEAREIAADEGLETQPCPPSP